MADDTPPPPPGFKLDDAAPSGGDAPPAEAGAPPPPPGFTLDKSSEEPKAADAPKDKGKAAIESSIGMGAAEAALNYGTGILALPVEAAASLYKLATAPAGERVREASKASSAVGEAMTYQPRTDTGQALTRVMNYPAELIGKASEGLGKWATDVTGNEAIGAAAAMIPQAGAVIAGEMIPGAAGKAIGRTDAALERSAADAAPRNAAAVKAHELNLQLAPSEIGGPVLQTAQTVAGGPKVEKEISANNAMRVQELAKLDLDMHPHDVLDQHTLDAKRKEAEAPYEALRATGPIETFKHQSYQDAMVNTGADFAKIDRAFPSEPGIHEHDMSIDMSEIERLKGKYFQPSFTADEAMTAMRQLRADARKNLKTYNPRANAVGIVQRQIADNLLGLLDEHAKALGKPELVPAFEAARKRLAKIQDFDDAMVGDRISARSLSRMYDDGKGRPMTGHGKSIAEAATRFQKSFQDADPTQWRGYLSAVDYFIGVAGAIHNPALSAGVMARPITRGILKSKRVQKGMVRRLQTKQDRGPARAVKKIAENPATGPASAASVGGSLGQVDTNPDMGIP